MTFDLDEVRTWIGDAPAHRGELEAFLNESPRPAILRAMSDVERREWADLCVEAIYALDHRLEDLLRWRADELDQHPLFETLSQHGSGQ